MMRYDGWRFNKHMTNIGKNWRSGEVWRGIREYRPIEGYTDFFFSFLVLVIFFNFSQVVHPETTGVKPVSEICKGLRFQYWKLCEELIWEARVFKRNNKGFEASPTCHGSSILHLIPGDVHLCVQHGQGSETFGGDGVRWMFGAYGSTWYDMTTWTTGRRWISSEEWKRGRFHLSTDGTAAKNLPTSQSRFSRASRKENMQRFDTWQALCTAYHSMQWFADIEWNSSGPLFICLSFFRSLPTSQKVL